MASFFLMSMYYIPNYNNMKQIFSVLGIAVMLSACT
ncbi:MAG: lipoprotein, partial [Pedobacter sp.]|nr:lipoprotein [Pedobacter sp.]